MSKMNRVAELEEILREASLNYYSGEQNDCELSDSDWDQLRDELEDLDPSNPFLKEVGAPASSALTKVKHDIPMGSLRKINTSSEFATWLKTLSKTIQQPSFVVQHKLDGSSIEIVYKKGEFKQAITRGDGIFGEDVTHSVKNASGFPKKLSKPLDISVRSECFLTISDWEKHLSSTSNPRNAASGVIRRTDGQNSNFLKTMAFDLISDELDIVNETEKIEWLQSNGFETTVSRWYASSSEVEQIVKDFENSRSSLGFEIDGAVIKVYDISQQNTLGEHDGRPYWARAWKFPPMGGRTTLLDVEWSVGTHGTINPVGKVTPVKVGGTVIQNITLHNADEIERLGLCIGDEVEVIRAGDVIPKILKVVSAVASGDKRRAVNRKPITISNCPACGGGVKRVGPKMFCSKGDSCTGSLAKRIDKWISKREIMFLGDSNLELLLKNGCVSSITDLYSLTADKMTAAGLGGRMSEKILEEIDKSRTVSLSDFIGSMSLDMIGRSEAANIVRGGFTTLSDWKNISVDALLKLDGYQKTKADRIVNSVKLNWQLISDLAEVLKITTCVTPKVIIGPLNNKSFCFTGTMKTSRKILQQMVIDNGGVVRDSVSDGLNFLVTDNPESNSSKNQKAQKLGVNRISEDDFLKMLQKQ